MIHDCMLELALINLAKGLAMCVIFYGLYRIVQAKGDSPKR